MASKVEIAENVFLRVSGGKPSNEIDVRREDILGLLPAAIDLIMYERDNEVIRRNLALQKSTGSYPVENGNIALSETFTPTWDDTRELHQHKLSGTPRNSVQFIPSASNNITGIPMVFCNSRTDALVIKPLGQIAWWFETNDEGSFAVFDNMSKPACEVLFRTQYSIETVDDNTELNLPDGVEMRVIEMLTNFFIGQRMQPDDTKFDQIDEAEKR